MYNCWNFDHTIFYSLYLAFGYKKAQRYFLNMFYYIAKKASGIELASVFGAFCFSVNLKTVKNIMCNMHKTNTLKLYKNKLVTHAQI